MAYSEKQKKQLLDEICQRIIEGEAVRNILRDKHMPTYANFYKWIQKDPDKEKQYARAKEVYAEKVFDEITLIADGTGDDILIDEDGKEQVNHNVIQRDRLRIDARKWALSKMLPKKYGDKLELDNQHSGEIKITRNIKS